MQRGDHFRIGVREGDILAGKYRVDRVLGTGGMGVVVAARHLKLDERVAIKFLHPDALENAEAVARFDREARAAVKIKSEHVARIIDVGTLDNGAPYMIMEHLDGEDLARWLATKGPLAIDQAVEFVLQTCEAISEAHSLGIVHRDLKPSNLFCIRRADGLFAIKVLDFGISKIMGSASGEGMDMTRTGAVMGSPLYMSPEQLRSARSVDARTDIWSVGIILFELLAGRPPFTGEALPEVCMAISAQPTPSLRASRPDVPLGLEAAVGTCLAKDRQQRYANVAELAVALAPYGPKRARVSVDRITRVISSAGLSASALSLPPSSDSIAPSGPATLDSWGNTARSFRQRAGVLGGGAIVVAALAGAAFMRFRPAEDPSAMASSNATVVPLPSSTAIAATPLAAPQESSAGRASSPPPVARPAESASASTLAPPVGTSAPPPVGAIASDAGVASTVPGPSPRKPPIVAAPPVGAARAPAPNHATPVPTTTSEFGGRL